MKGFVLLEEFQIGTTALEAGLELDLVLDDEGVILVGDGLVELAGDGVVGSLVLEDETLVALNATEDRGFLDGPLAVVCPLLLGALLLCV